jgi:hypothetical protein
LESSVDAASGCKRERQVEDRQVGTAIPLQGGLIMIELIICFVSGCIVGACFGAIAMAVVSTAKKQALPQWNDYWPPPTGEKS